MYSTFFNPLQREQTPSIQQSRLLFLLKGICIFASLVTWRIVQLCWWRVSVEEDRKTHHPSPPFRRDIVDRRGIVVATNVRTYSIYAHGKTLKNPEKTARILAAWFPEHVTYDALYKKLALKKPFTWIMRHLSPEQVRKIQGKETELGIEILQEEKRFYPYGPLFSHTVGITDVDLNGISGLEKSLDEDLKDSPLATPLSLTLDARCQYILRDELLQAMRTFNAQGANGMLVHIPTGEIYACTSLPDFDPHEGGGASEKSRFNRNTSGIYEMGSILKIHNTALALEEGSSHLGSRYDASKPIAVGRFRINDFRGKKRPLTIAEAFIYSSNIANAKMALAAGPEVQKMFFERLGLLEKIDSGIPENSTPLFPAVWNGTVALTLAYGYGGAWSPIHMAQSISALMDGKLRPLMFYQKHTTPSRIIASPKTCRAICMLMRANVLHGQAKGAHVEGFDIGGKTGTANKRNGKTYQQGNNLTSFVLVYPTSAPKWLLFIQIDAPQATAKTHGYATAGWIAPPTAAAIFKRLASVMGWAPDLDLPKVVPLSLQSFIDTTR